MNKRNINSTTQTKKNLHSPVPQLGLGEMKDVGVVCQVRTSAVDGGIDANVAGVEQVQNIVGNDNCERVRLSESESEN